MNDSAIAHKGYYGVSPGTHRTARNWKPAWLWSADAPAETVQPVAEAEPATDAVQELQPVQPDSPAPEPQPVELADCPGCGGPIRRSCLGVHACDACQTMRWRWLGRWTVVPMHRTPAGLPGGYTGDIVKPLKTLLGESFASIEAKIERAIAERFGLAYPWSAAVKAAVKDADDLLLAIEARDLMGGAELLGLSVPAPEHQPITTPLTAAVAERQFLERFGEAIQTRLLSVAWRVW